ncbi:MAG: hypothetical protein JWN68_591 [Nocardioides sp.]|uniref:hypothetical protein n=1 Tax=Nocardioides sp. TaxID=35761 RepID=UPI0026022E47|nr:hypothetical protein [Nocardioides sp.]MCW2832638.1 hypothetical protein [Nocardioides sp.]
MARLIHLNGPPGIGKSTLARRYVADHPGVLNCDIDVLRTLIGGWEGDFGTAGALIRPSALAMIGAYLAARVPRSRAIHGTNRSEPSSQPTGEKRRSCAATPGWSSCFASGRARS